MRPARRRRLLLAFLILLTAVALATLGGVAWVRRHLVLSLPRMDGTLALAGLTAPVRIERDALGVPTIHGANRRDVALATGFLHAQDRFFEMDTLRRGAAGELAELLGKAGLESDRRVRLHRLRAVAVAALAHLPDEDRALVDSYTHGVNQGLRALGRPPFEYLALRTDPAPWKPEDTLLTLLAIFVDLQGQKWQRESALALMDELLPPQLASFLAPPGTEWDAPLTGPAYATPPIVPAGVFDLRAQAREAALSGSHIAAGDGTLDAAFDSDPVAGSNAIAVAGPLAEGGGVMVGNDLHLGLRVPNLWYRASFAWPAGPGESGLHQVTGVTLPGLPFMVIGSNTRVAWGMTNLEGDTSDLVAVDLDPRDRRRYLVPGGSEELRHEVERIRVRGEADETLNVWSTRWGPLVDRDRRGRPRALSWVAQYPEAVDIRLIAMETAADVTAGLAAANRAGLPALNVLVCDAAGNLAWSVAGRLPRRVGFSGRVPVSWADGRTGWRGWLTPAEYPVLRNPSSGRLWTANNRAVDGADLQALGDGGYVFGARARQLRDDLLALPRASGARDLLGVLLDDRARFLNHWRTLLLDTLSAAAVKDHPERRELRRLVVERWDGRASPDSAGYRLVHDFRLIAMAEALRPLIAACKRADPGFKFPTQQAEGPLWRLLRERPVHLLNPRYRSWDELLLAAVDGLIAEYRKDGIQPLAEATWGRGNEVAIQHPLSQAVPLLSRWLDMPTLRLPGDDDMPRVQKPHFGASVRMVVSPGREAAGILEMPCGQSGNPISPHYWDSQEGWAKGEPTPFLPGPARHRLNLVPRPPAAARR
jgi:penicillin amidase